MYNQTINESLAVLASAAPASQGVGSVAVGPVTTALFRRFLLEVHVGALGAAGTVTVKFQAGATSGGSFADVAGAALTVVNSGTENVLRLEIRSETLAALGVGPYLKGIAVVAGNAVQLGAILYGAANRYAPASDYNEAAVTQALAV